MNKRVASFVDILLFSLFLSLFVLPAHPPKVETQSCPGVQPLNRSNPPSLCWPGGATVGYYFTFDTSDPDAHPFTQQEINLYSQAFSAWNQHNDYNHNCSGVIFSAGYGSGQYSVEVRRISDLYYWSTDLATNGSYRPSALIEVGNTNPFPATDALKQTIMIH